MRHDYDTRHPRRRGRLDGTRYGAPVTIRALFQRTLKDLTAPEFDLVMRRFLGVARMHPLNYGLVRTSLLTSIVALVLLRGSAGDPESASCWPARWPSSPVRY